MPASACIFCQIGRIPTSTRLLYQDERIVAFQDIKPSAFRHYLVIPIEHIPTVKNLQRGQEHYTLVSHMLNVGKSLLQQDAAQSNEHSWKFIKYSSLGPLGGFVQAETLLEKLATHQVRVGLAERKGANNIAHILKEEEKEKCKPGRTPQHSNSA